MQAIPCLLCPVVCAEYSNAYPGTTLTLTCKKKRVEEKDKGVEDRELLRAPFLHPTQKLHGRRCKQSSQSRQSRHPTTLHLL